MSINRFKHLQIENRPIAALKPIPHNARAHTRGFLGIICCRHIDKKTQFRRGCRDTAQDGRGYILALDDRDIEQMLELISKRNRNAIDRFLNDLLEELIN
jgi:hypothetical protein